ncbi:unnamed protein product [Amoebophrya sp. A25]|nr:unnamed protein product [Amoebophrya sp. A25]|eukprot:GSA25T00009850001.1
MSRGRSRASRGRSRSRDRATNQIGAASKQIQVSNADAAFILGKHGKTKVKIARASGAESLNLDDLKLEAHGTNEAVDRAIKYANFLMAQRLGPVTVSGDKDNTGDLTLLEVPNDAVGFVTGRGGNFLRAIEEEWSVLMFFAEYEKKSKSGRESDVEMLAIFGADRRNRRGAELKVLSAVESKHTGWYKLHEKEILDRDKEGDEWKSGTMEFEDDHQLSFALGKQGATRRKLEKASGCILQYVGNTAIFTGTKHQRKTLRQYMKWLFAQLDGPVDVPDAEERDDCTMLKIPQECVGYITGARRAALSTIEMDFGCLMFFTGSKDDKRDFEMLAIFGPESARKGAELKVKSSVEAKSRGYYAGSLRENKEEWGRPGFATDVLRLVDNDIGYVLGKGGVTRVKLANASGCHLQYIGDFACIAGTQEERRNCRDYIHWLLDQRNGKIDVDSRGRNDILEMTVPEECIGWVTGKQGVELRKIEEKTKTFCFLARDPSRNGHERLLICGTFEGTRAEEIGRAGAQRLVEDLVREKRELDANRQHHGGGRFGGGYGGPPPRRGDSRRRGGGRGDSRNAFRGGGRPDSRRRGGGGGRGGGRRESRGRGGGRGGGRF